MKDIIKLARVQLIIIPIFIFFKAIRPSVLSSQSPDFFKTTLLSLPNFFEAVTGTLVVTGLALLLNAQLKNEHQLKPVVIYILSIIVAGVYVILQELNIIDIRSNTTMDPIDIAFSLIGLAMGYWIVVKIGPTIQSD